MRIDIMTLFPDTVGDVLSESILGRAQERGILRIETHQIRDYTANRQNQRVYPGSIQLLQVPRQPGHLVSPGHGVHRHMDPNPPLMGKGHRPG